MKVDTNKCWLWAGYVLSTGYGRVEQYSGGKVYRYPVHRLSYEHHKGKIPDGLVIDHLCRVRTCINPDHLEAVKQRVNILRGIGPAAKNLHKKACINGHEFDEANTYIQYRKSGSERVCRTCRRNSVARTRKRVTSSLP